MSNQMYNKRAILLKIKNATKIKDNNKTQIFIEYCDVWVPEK